MTPTIESTLTAWRDAGVAQVAVFDAARSRGQDHAFHRMDDLVEGVARVDVTNKALALVSDLREIGCPDDEVKRRLLGELRRSVLAAAVRVPVRRSTSASADMMDRARLSARAMLLEALSSAWPGVLCQGRL